MNDGGPTPPAGVDPAVIAQVLALCERAQQSFATAQYLDQVLPVLRHLTAQQDRYLRAVLLFGDPPLLPVSIAVAETVVEGLRAIQRIGPRGDWS